MNIEQIEATLREFKNKLVSVNIPIRGSIFISLFGTLNIVEDWNSDDSHILYTIYDWQESKSNVTNSFPGTSVSFRSKDVFNIIQSPSKTLVAAITLIIEQNAGLTFA